MHIEFFISINIQAILIQDMQIFSMLNVNSISLHLDRMSCTMFFSYFPPISKRTECETTEMIQRFAEIGCTKPVWVLLIDQISVRRLLVLAACILIDQDHGDAIQLYAFEERCRRSTLMRLLNLSGGALINRDDVDDMM